MMIYLFLDKVSWFHKIIFALIWKISTNINSSLKLMGAGTYRDVGTGFHQLLVDTLTLFQYNSARISLQITKYPWLLLCILWRKVRFSGTKLSKVDFLKIDMSPWVIISFLGTQIVATLVSLQLNSNCSMQLTYLCEENKTQFFFLFYPLKPKTLIILF